MDAVQIEQVALSQIDPGERLLWSGAPAPGSAAVSALPSTLFGIPFFAFACFWIWGAWSATSAARGPGGPPAPFMFFPLFGLPFAIVGLGLVLGPLWAYLGALRTVYAVTERRAVIIGGLRARSVRSFTPADIRDVTRIERADGSGTLYFATRSFATNNGLTKQRRIGFTGIPEVRRVEKLIRDHLQSTAA